MTSSQNCSTNNQIIISESSIRTLDGLYSLNDLHKAAGGESKHQPAFFMRNEQTLALIEELNSANLQSLENTSDAMSCRTITGRNGGTYVCKELVYAYAMWISAKFSLIVIRAFDALQTAARAEYTVNKADTLTKAEQDTLRKIITQHAESLPEDKRGPAIMKMWSKLKSHFKVSYRLIPRSEFAEAVSLLTRATLDGQHPQAQIVRCLLVFDPVTGRVSLDQINGDSILALVQDKTSIPDSAVPALIGAAAGRALMATWHPDKVA